MDWSPFVVCAPEEYAPPTRGIGSAEGIADRLRTAAFAERQAFAAFTWAADTVTDASDVLLWAASLAHHDPLDAHPTHLT